MNEEKRRDTCVFILGAGASYAYDSTLPLMRGFFTRAREELQEHQDQSNGDSNHVEYHREFARHYQAVLDFYDRFTNTANVKKEFVFKKGPDYLDDLERLFTQVDLMRSICEPNSRKLLEDFAWVVWDLYCRFPQISQCPPYEELCDQIIGKLELFPAFITTNYDLLLERKLWGCSKGGKYSRFYYPGFQNFHSAYSPVVRFDPDRNNRFLRQLDTQKNETNGEWEIPIIKLHGSASWFELENSEWIGASKFFGPDRFELDSFRQDVCKVMRKDVTRPAIIPPLLSKSAMHDAINLQWTAAVQQLQWAKYIVSVGYSFPVTDTFMQRLMSQALLKNKRLQGFYIVEKQCGKKQREARKQRYQQIFDKKTKRVKIREFKCGAEQFYEGFLADPKKFLKRGAWKSLREFIKK